MRHARAGRARVAPRKAASKIRVEGERYPAELEKRTGFDKGEPFLGHDLGVSRR